MTQRSSARRFYIIIALLTLILAVLIASSFVPHKGTSERFELIENYLQALENKDERSMRRLVHPNFEARAAVQGKIEQLGGNEIALQEVCYSLLKPFITVASLRGSYVDENLQTQQIQERLFLKYEPGPFYIGYKGRWYLSLGQSKSFYSRDN